MADFFEIDFLDSASATSGDAIPLRYGRAGATTIHVVDAGGPSAGEKVVAHIRTYYGNPSRIDRVIVTHPDGDHADGLRKVLEEFAVGELWMLRPWLYAEELLPRFSHFASGEDLSQRLKALYPHLTALEAIAEANAIPICAPFQGAAIGAFTVMAPSKDRYLDLIVASERTPEFVHTEHQEQTESAIFAAQLRKVAEAEKEVAYAQSAWGEEMFSEEDTSAENEMSVVQYAQLCGEKILLTGDAGRAALSEAADFAPSADLTLPGIHYFQAPHHGSWHNVSTPLLDRWLGRRFDADLAYLAGRRQNFISMISAAKEDRHHPRKAVVRAMLHRGGKVLTTEGQNLCIYRNAPMRNNWAPTPALAYPEEQEE